MNKARPNPDYIIVAAILLLLTIGVIMVYSASAAYAHHRYGDLFFYAKRQLLFAALGVFLMFVVANLEREVFIKWVKPSLWACFILLLLVLIPGVGLLRGGARSWLGIGAFSIQPSEFMKLALIAYLSYSLSTYSKDLNRFWTGLFPRLAVVGAAFGLIMLQPDLGTGTVLVGTGIMILFVAGARLKHLFGLSLLGVAGFTALVLEAPYRIRRITAFIDPWEDPLGAGYHLIQSLYAIGPGGLLGLGLGMSRQKHLYLPEPHTDFIFSILAEEFGFIGAAIVIILFAVVVWRGLRTAIVAPDLFSSLLATGITSMIAIQAIINIGVVSGAFPVTGITLPFLSYGGSSLTLSLMAVGVLLNISRDSHKI